MRILAIEPYFGGSHRDFLEGWQRHSQHAWTVHGLPAYKWKWRMRHASLTLADRVKQQIEAGQTWDCLFCSDMLNLPEFLGMVGGDVASLPAVIYFHENQLTYPTRQPRDYHYGYSNFLSAVRADAVWFNTQFHQDEFVEELRRYLVRMPDFHHLEAIDALQLTASVCPPGVDPIETSKTADSGPLKILWCARWEYDKNPETFFDAIAILNDAGVPFRLAVVGPSFREVPPVFERARQEFASRIDHWGYQESRDQYHRVLAWADVIVSSAIHEFFGLSVVEAILAGAFPLVPDRLSYPEVLGAESHLAEREFFYDGSQQQLSSRLRHLAARKEKASLWSESYRSLQQRLTKLTWPHRAPAMDSSLEQIKRRMDTSARSE